MDKNGRNKKDFTSRRVTRKKILITAGRSPITLELARQLNAQGHQIIVADNGKYYISRFSNYIQKGYTLPNPRFHSKQFLQSLKNLINKEKIDYYIPIFEEGFYVAANINMFDSTCKIFLDDFGKLINLHNKWSFNQLLKQHGFLYPKTKLLTNLAELENLIDSGYILKKAYTHAAQDIVYLDTKKDIKKITINEKNPWIIQEYIEGKKYCSYSICHAGKVNAFSLYPVQYSIDKSSCIYYESIEDEAIFNWVTELIQKINYTGQIGFDFIKTAEGKLYAIECNPRATAGAHLFNPKECVDQAFFNQNTQLIQSKPGTKKMIGIAMLLYGWRTTKALVSSKSFLKTFSSSSDVIYKKHDIKPYFVQFIICTSYWFKAKQKKIRLTAAFYYDLVWTSFNNCHRD